MKPSRIGVFPTSPIQPENLKPERVQVHNMKPERVEIGNLKSDRVQRRAKADRDERPSCETAPWPASQLDSTRTKARQRLLVWQPTPASRPGEPDTTHDDQALAA